MRTSEMAKELVKLLLNLKELFLERNLKYADEGMATSNFERNAKYNEVYRIFEVIDKPYGVSIHYVLQKLDRLVNELILVKQGKLNKVSPDHIDDSIVYLFITRMLLKEAGLIE